MKHLAAWVCCWLIFEGAGSYWYSDRIVPSLAVCFEALNHKVGKWPTGQLARTQITGCDYVSGDFFLSSILPWGFEFSLTWGQTVVDSPLSSGTVIQMDLLWPCGHPYDPLGRFSWAQLFVCYLHLWESFIYTYLCLWPSRNLGLRRKHEAPLRPKSFYLLLKTPDFREIETLVFK